MCLVLDTTDMASQCVAEWAGHTILKAFLHSTNQISAPLI